LRRFLKGRQLEVEVVIIMHPSARACNWGGNKEEWLSRQATRIMTRQADVPCPGSGRRRA
jgi:hypothetical protein